MDTAEYKMNYLKRIVSSLWTYRVLRWSLAAVFVFSGLSKLADLKTFASIINAYGLIPAETTFAAATLISIAELAAGLMLIFDMSGGLSMITVMLGLFIAVLLYGIYLGLDVDCGCFGPDDSEKDAFSNLRAALYRDVGFVAVAVYLYFWQYLYKGHVQDEINVCSRGRGLT